MPSWARALPVLLLHGFASDHSGNWVAPGVVDALVAADRRVIAPDARGHGASGKPHDPAAYANDAMVRDAEALLDHLHLDAVDVVGYSMGAIVAGRLAPVEERVRSLVLGGVGGRVRADRRNTDRAGIADALVVEDQRSVQDPAARVFRRFAERRGADRLALAAIQRAPHPPSRIDEISVPTLILVGADDALIGPPEQLAARIAGARVRVVGGNHLTAMYDPEFAAAIVDFLAVSGPIHAEQVDDEDERLAGADDAARTPIAVAELRRDDESPATADAHAGDTVVPALDHLARAESERERLAAVPRRVELLARRPRVPA